MLAFGAKIVRRSGWDQVWSVLLTEPIEGTVRHYRRAGTTGAPDIFQRPSLRTAMTRRDCAGGVAGWPIHRFRVYRLRKTVRANRIETLLL